MGRGNEWIDDLFVDEWWEDGTNGGEEGSSCDDDVRMFRASPGTPVLGGCSDKHDCGCGDC